MVTRSIYLATWPKSFGRRALLRDRGQAHVGVIAPARSGKGVSVVIPTLHTWPDSVVVMDIKGENFRLTAGRRKQLGSVVLKFDPTAEGSCCFNPFDEIPVGTPDEWGEIDNIATSLLDPRGRGAAMDSHWDRQGVGWVGAALCHLLYAEQDKTLRGLAHLIAGFNPVAGGGDINKTLTRIRDTRHTPAGPHPDIAREMQMMMDKSPNERSGIISTVQGFLKIYRDPRIAAATSRSDFRITDLMNYKRPVSLYLVIPVKDMDRIQPLLRLVLNQIVKGLTPRMETDQLPRWKLLLMLDEFCVLGHMELLSKMLPFIPGYGIRACVIAQNLTQIEAAYGRDQPIVQTCETLLALTPNRDDIQTAEFLSKLAGDTTVVERHRSWSSSGPSSSEQKTRRALMTPGEVLELPTTKALIFKRGAKPLLADQFVYYRNKTFRHWAALKPPAESDRIHEGADYSLVRVYAPPAVAIEQASREIVEIEGEAIPMPPAHISENNHK
jgi:type IV secretion system protein VirD4